MLSGSNRLSDISEILFRGIYRCDLLGLKATINFEITCSSKFLLVTVSFAARLTEEDMELSAETAVHCWLKNLLK